MKKYIFTAMTAIVALASCSDSLLEDKKLYGKYNYNTVYDNYETAQNRIDLLYYLMQPGKNEGGSYNAIVSNGSDDAFAKATEEYGGISEIEDNLLTLGYNEINNGGKFTWDHFYVENKETSPWGYIRNINDAIEGLTDGSLPAEKKNELLGQAYFIRAWRYYTMVKWYGGIPIIDRVQPATIGALNGENVVIPRRSTKECIDFICADLDKAIDMLPKSWPNSAKDWGRATAGTAAALKGRVLLLFASPLFNRADKAERWTAAYEANKKALEILAEGGFGLAYENNPGTTTESAANWAKIFLNNKGTDGTVNEAVFVTLYNKLDAADNQQMWNGWENSIRPRTAYAGGGKQPTMEMIDAFPMADGKQPGQSGIAYDKTLFFVDRDPRFYRTFTFPGEQWRFMGQPNAQLVDRSKPAEEVKYESLSFWGSYPYDGDKYEFWGYTWYADAEKKANPANSGWGADILGNSNASVLVRKRSDDLGINSSPLYTYTYTNANAGFRQSATPFMEMRFAEVLLNYAEAAAACNRFDESFNALKRIRSRVYSQDEDSKCDANFGLTMPSTRAEALAQVLFERRIELAYEGKRFEDMRRWMLFDGGLDEVEGQPATWKLSGDWAMGTCAYLGVTPTNGYKNHYLEVTCQELAAEADKNANDKGFGLDPILAEDFARPAALDPSNRLAGQKQLADFYTDFLERKERNADGNNDEQNTLFHAQYYFLGLNYSAMYNNATLYQTIGWEDYSHGGQGIFDPLEEDPDKIPVDNSGSDIEFLD